MHDLAAQVSHDPLIGLVWRGFRIERRIAQGGMGAVYLARNVMLPKTLRVLKVLLPEFAGSVETWTSAVDRFRKEALILEELASAHGREDFNIVGVHDAGVLDDGRPCMLMDYIVGQTLDEATRVYNGRVPPYRALQYTCHIARALDFAHAADFVHRDLKPSNIIVCPRHNDPCYCVLLDFGIAKLSPRFPGGFVPTMSGAGFGSPSYMAVEQFRNAEHATPLADVYALAIIIWEMVTGALPWGLHDTSTPLGLAQLYDVQRRQAPAPPPPGTLPTAWEATLRSALSPDLEARPLSIRHFVVDLATGLETSDGQVQSLGLTPSGLDILRSIAPKFIAQLGHDAETVRNPQARLTAVAWPRQSVQRVEIPTAREIPPPVQGTPPMAPTVTAPPFPSTLGALSGAMVALPSSPRTRYAFLTMLVAVLSVGVIGIVGMIRTAGREADPPAVAPSRSPAAPDSSALKASSTAAPNEVVDRVSPAPAKRAPEPALSDRSPGPDSVRSGSSLAPSVSPIPTHAASGSVPMEGSTIVPSRAGSERAPTQGIAPVPRRKRTFEPAAPVTSKPIEDARASAPSHPSPKATTSKAMFDREAAASGDLPSPKTTTHKAAIDREAAASGDLP